jgi:hypothetical protein
MERRNDADFNGQARRTTEPEGHLAGSDLIRACEPWFNTGLLHNESPRWLCSP